MAWPSGCSSFLWLKPDLLLCWHSMETRLAGTASQQSGDRRSVWALPMVLAGALGVTALLLVIFRQRPAEPPADASARAAAATSWTPAPPPQIPTASLTIDFGNGVRREFERVPWKAGMTIGDLLRAARNMAPGVTFTQQGEGKMALLTSIDGVANGAADGRFWLYDVNGRPGEVSFDLHPVAAGDRVLWVFKQAE